MDTAPPLGPTRFFSPPGVEANTRPPSLGRASTACSRSTPNARPGPLDHHAPSRFTSRSRMVTPEEYDALPSSIQRKYFSPVERLRIAQESATLKRKKQQQQQPPPSTSLKEAYLLSKPSLDSLRPKTAHSFKSSSPAQPRKSFSSRIARSDADVDEQQAIRFLTLPEKVKRSHFTPEELALLAESSERALGSHSAVGDDHPLHRVTIDRNGSICSSKNPSSASEDFRDDPEKDWSEMETEAIQSLEGRGSHEAEFSKFYPSRRKGSMNSSFSALPPIPSGRDVIQSYPTRRLHTRLAPIPLPPPTLLPAIPSIPSSKLVTNVTTEFMQPPADSLMETPPSTRYYKDSQARQRLREYLASPEKFDEALEFGFPHSFPQRSTSLHSSVEPGLQMDVESDDCSVTGSNGNDGASITSPRTPSVANECFSEPVGTYSSMDSGVALPCLIQTGKTVSARSLSPDILGREMTLKLTLTRPDLRAPEKELYAFQRTQVSGVNVETSDPLALEALPVCDDHTGAHGAFAMTKPSSSGGFKKVWKNLRGR